MAPPVVALRGVLVSRAGRTILEIPDLAVDRGQVLAIIGPNGAGKSTLLRVMGLLEPATAGAVRFQGGIPAIIIGRVTLRSADRCGSRLRLVCCQRKPTRRKR